MKPFDDGGEMDDAEENAVEFFEASGESAEDLHALKEIFNQMPSLVTCLVQGALFLAVGLARNDDGHPVFFRIAHDGIGVISLIANERLGRHIFEQLGSNLAVVSLARRQHKPQRITKCVA